MRHLLILSQVYVPDPASVGQHLHDVARAMVRRGWRVTVLCSERGYEDPSRRYPLSERLDGVDVRRIGNASFGKRNIAVRVAGTASFMAQVFARAARVDRPDLILFSTSPPMIGAVARVLRRLHGCPAAYWAMDLNPDQLVALGKLRPDQPTTKFLERANKKILDDSAKIVALDRFMADRLRGRADLNGKLATIAPWPHEDSVAPVAHADNPFRARHGLQGKFVVMYSGNHSPANPLDTLLAAALRLKDRDDLVFAFIGGGLGKKDVEKFVAEHKLTNALLLPYQPLADLRFSLSAADAHVVSLGPEMVGIVHPCKVYGAMAVGRPLLYLGPRPSHVSDLLDGHDLGRAVAHGDVDGCVAALLALRDLSEAKRAAMGDLGRRVLAESLSQRVLLPRFCDVLEEASREPRP